MMTTAGHDDPFRALLDVGAALVSSAALDDALQNVAAAIGAAMRVATVDIQSWDRVGGRLVEEAYWSVAGVTDVDREVLGTSIPLAEHPTARRVLDERRIVECRADDPETPDECRKALAAWGLTTTLDAPLLIGDEVIGVVGVAEARFPRRFLSMEVDLFEQLSGMAAAAMRNARLSRRERRHSRHLDALLEIGRQLSADSGPDGAAAAAVDALTGVLGASFAAVYETGAHGGDLITRAAGPAGAVAAGDRAGVAAALAAALLDDSLLGAAHPARRVRPGRRLSSRC